ncbi:phosphoheptose isomerase [Malonomonas rubra DSM 5091]|uniref:Phosphoheptose isomerase n=1 Tax=Malonomonas rubra DSM 5091 TaxID=1122189 RepID=A0A1M6C8J2_MALRU|nr:D-sedoheptulose 7-phosphate isomerase [Malonomonas rubra]SHI57074.1 phosphoheptose isomerase [Malonomonas rubra DSM 5091]
MQDKIQHHFDRHLETLHWAKENLSSDIQRCVEMLCDALRQGKKILIMGNGGSAADSQHFAAELVGRFLKNRAALPAIALTTDTSILTAVGNDFGFDQIFSRQVEALAEGGDVVIGISTSGNSENVRIALEQARQRKCLTVALLGRDGGEIAELADLPLTVKVQETPFIQETHLTVIHLLCDLVEQELFRA